MFYITTYETKEETERHMAEITELCNNMSLDEIHKYYRYMLTLQTRLVTDLRQFEQDEKGVFEPF